VCCVCVCPLRCSNNEETTRLTAAGKTQATIQVCFASQSLDLIKKKKPSHFPPDVDRICRNRADAESLKGSRTTRVVPGAAERTQRTAFFLRTLWSLLTISVTSQQTFRSNWPFKYRNEKVTVGEHERDADLWTWFVLFSLFDVSAESPDTRQRHRVSQSSGGGFPPRLLVCIHAQITTSVFNQH